MRNVLKNILGLALASGALLIATSAFAGGSFGAVALAGSAAVAGSPAANNLSLLQQSYTIEEFSAPDNKVEAQPKGAQSLPYSPDGMNLFNEAEPNDTAATANALPGSQAVVLGNISPAADYDYFSFTANTGDRVYAATQTQWSNGGSTDTIVDIIASDGTTVLESDDDNGSFSGTSSAIGGTIIPASGTYYVKVDGFSGTSTIAPYHLHVRVQSGTPASEVEPNNDTTAATPLAASGWMSGTITAIADPDLFSFSLNAGDSVYLGLDMDPDRLGSNTNWNGRLGLGVLGGYFLIANDGGTTKPHAEAFFMTVQQAGTYYAYVDSTSATGLGPNARYNLSVSIYPKAVQPNCTTFTSTDVPKNLGPGVGTTTSTIAVPGIVTSSITDINATIVLTHAVMADLDVALLGPTAASIPLFTDIGATATGGQTQMNIGLDDQAALPIGTFTVVEGMINQPEQPGRLATFNGTPAGGVWTLQLADDTTNASGGVLQSWSLEICGDPPPAYDIELTKTVGTVPAVCATTDSIEVPPGGFDVYYCYTVRNTGLNALDTHDLVDSELGTLFTGMNYVLAPGATYSYIEQATVDQAVTNTGTWTATAGANTVSDSDTATVNVRSSTTCPVGHREVAVDYSFFEDPFPSAGWTVTNTTTGCNGTGAVPEWTNTNPSNRLNLTGGTGKFAIADSDKCGSGSSLNTIMTTGMLDFTGLISPTVSFYTDYYDLTAGANDRANFDVSTDGGATWSNLIAWNENHRGPLLVTQALPGAGDNDVMVRWDYAGNWAWWWQVDDVIVSACEPTWTVTPSAGSNGAIAPPTPQTVNSGATTTFTVTPNPGYSASVGGSCGGALVGTTYTTNAITADCTVDATFTIITYTVTPSAGSNGTIAPSVPQTVNSGATTTFTVTPNAGYSASVGGSCGGALVGTTYTTNAITANCTVDATFTAITYTVTPSAGSNGTIAPSVPQTVNSGATTTFAVTPNPGYSASVGGSCGGTLVGTTYTTNAITANCTVDATFAMITHTVTSAVVGGNGSIAPSGVQTVPDGGNITFTLTPNPGYEIDSVSGCGGTLVGNVYTTGPITADCTVSASFRLTPVAASAHLIPTLNSWVLGLLGLLMAGFALLLWPRRTG